ncbi:MAG: tetratricopeptide (TPR) repeat protein [Roseivirga sp.]|jgi:tetratricopeptide (TPR) repeat protein
MIKYFCFFSLTISISFSVYAQKTLEDHFNEGRVAYEAKDYKLFLKEMETVDQMRPNYPIAIFRLAAAYALNKKKAKSIEKLKQLLLMDATYDLELNPDFKSLKSTRPFENLLVQQAKLNRVEENDEVFRTFDLAEIHPESFVILDNGDILFGSVREKKIVRVDQENNRIDLVKTPYAVLGMHLDEVTKTLWVATAALPEMEDYDAKDYGKSLVMQIDPYSGVVIQGIEYDDRTIVGDLAIDSQSRIWLSNSLKPNLSRDDTDTTSYLGNFVRKQFDLRGAYFNLQGLTLSDDEQFLYFADYISGIAKINIATDDITRLIVPEEVLIKGIDGLYYYDNTLIAIHNGVKPYRIMQYFLDETGDTILYSRIINQGGESLGEPTLGQIKDGYFYYLANSPWGAYTDAKELDLGKLVPIEIRRIKLD